MRSLRSDAGLTLIEMAVAVGVSLIIIGGIVTNFNSFNETQKLKQASLTLKNNLRYAQTQANAGNKPTSGCTELKGYTVTFASSSYAVQASCNNEGLVGDGTTTNLPTGVTFSSAPSSMTFGVLAQGLLGSEGVTITLSGNSKTYSIQVAVTGDITDVGFQ